MDEDSACTLLLRDVLEHKDVSSTSHKGDLLEHMCAKVLPSSAEATCRSNSSLGCSSSHGLGCYLVAGVRTPYKMPCLIDATFE